MTYSGAEENNSDTYLESKTERRVWLKEITKGSPIPFGGIETPYIWQELHDSFEHGQYITCVILSAAIMEQLLGARILSKDSDYPIDDKTMGSLINDAKSKSLIGDSRKLDWLNDKRNGYLHYRHPLHSDRQAPTLDELLDDPEGNLDDINQKNARKAIEIVSEHQSRAWKEFVT